MLFLRIEKENEYENENGPTPASRGSQPRAASPVNIIGMVEGDATVFRAVKSGTMVRLSKMSEP